jgi:hypothetical protein
LVVGESLELLPKKDEKKVECKWYPSYAGGLCRQLLELKERLAREDDGYEVD